MGRTSGLLHEINITLFAYNLFQLADPNSLTHEPLWAIGNLALGVNPLLFVFSTIWLREHNRVCNILYRERPNATDEELYQTARLIITGIC